MTMKHKMTLASLVVSAWGTTKNDKGVSKKAAADAIAVTDAVSAQRVLVPSAMELGTKKAARAARATFDGWTSPWLSGGTRILPSRSIKRFIDDMNHHKRVYRDEAFKFATEYQKFLDENGPALRMGSLYDATDYPAADTVEAAFQITIDMSPLPDDKDWRFVDVEESVKTEMEQNWRRRLNEIEEQTERYWTLEFRTLLERIAKATAPKGRLVTSTLSKARTLAERISAREMDLDHRIHAESNIVVLNILDLVKTSPGSHARHLMADKFLKSIKIIDEVIDEKDEA